MSRPLLTAGLAFRAAAVRILSRRPRRLSFLFTICLLGYNCTVFNVTPAGAKHQAFLILLLVFRAPFAWAEGDRLEHILSTLRRAEEEMQGSVYETVYTARATVIEWEDPSRTRAASTNESLRRVYTRRPDQVHEEYLSMTVDGRALDPEEIQRELARQRRGGRRDGRFRSPFSPEMADQYEFTLLGSEDFEGQAAWSVGFRPRVPAADLVEGVLRVSGDGYHPLVVEMRPAKPPAVLQELTVSMRFAPVLGYWLPERFSMQMRLRVRFLVTFADRVLSIDDRYSDYRINPGIPDEVFAAR